MDDIEGFSQTDNWKKPIGFFRQDWQKERYEEIGLEEEFVQDNGSHSTKGGTARTALPKKHPQGKL